MEEKYTISEERKALLEEKFFEFDEEPDRAFFEAIDNPVELHFIARYYNWDEGMEVISWIVNSPLCDKATAAMIFWHSQPDFYTRFNNAEEATWAAEVYSLLRTIISKWEHGLYTTELISYDPRKDPEAPNDIDYRDPNEKWAIPDYLKQPIKGQFEVAFT